MDLKKIFKGKNKKPETVPIIPDHIHESTNPQPTTQGMPIYDIKLDEKVIGLITDEGNPQRLAALKKGERNILEKIIVKNLCVYGNNKNCNEYIRMKLNLSVSEEAKLLDAVVELSRPKMGEMQQPI